MALQQPGQQHGAEVPLELAGLAEQQHVLIVGEVQLAARVLVLGAHVFQLAPASPGWTKQNRLTARS